MTRLEKLGIDLTTVEGLANAIRISCREIGDEVSERCKPRSCPVRNKSCSECKAERLLAKVPTKTVKRWETYNGNLMAAYHDWVNLSNGSGVTTINFVKWLEEEVEVEE